MKREIKKHHLDFEKTISYFIDHIQCGKTLAERIVEKVKFNQGSFYTFLPSNAEISRLYEFPYGGIIPPIPYGNRTYKIEGLTENFHPQQVITMDRECSEFISSYVKSGTKNCAILEDYNLESDSPHANMQNVKMTPYGKEVYYFLNKNNSIEEVYKTMRTSIRVWHSLCVLTQINDVLVLDNEVLDQICNNAKFVITGAYDGEGYVFWEKNTS